MNRGNSGRRLAAILIADIVDYSRLMGEDEVRTLAALADLRRNLFEPVVTARSGKVIKRMGDGWIVEYPNISDATACAIEIQEKLQDHEIIRLRIGVHIGDVTFQDDDIYGDGINIAARLEALAEPGQVLISDTAQQSLDGKAAARFDGGEHHTLKNIARPVAVWRWPTGGKVTAPRSSGLALPDKPSIAVLPFDNMSGDPEQAFFSDGITEDIITALSKFRWLFVIARNSTFTYKDRAVQVTDIGRDLGVRYVVEGSVRKAGNRIRITAQLIDAVSGAHVWAERYDRDITDIFDLQDEITETIVGALEPEIGDVERVNVARKRTEDLAAWELFQRGISEIWRMDDEGTRAGIKLFRQAIEKDKSFAQPYSYLAFALLHQAYLGYAADPESAISEAAKITRHSIALDDKDALAHAISARIFTHDQRFDDALREAQQAIRLNPNYAFGYHTLATIHWWGNLRPKEGLEAADHAIRLSPNDPSFHLYLAVKGAILTELGHLDEALRLLNDACHRPHRDYRLWMTLTRCAVMANRMAEAKEAAEMMLTLRPDFTLARLRNQWHSNLHPVLLDSYEQQLHKLGFPLE